MRVINVVGQTFGRLIVRQMLPGSRVSCDCECGTVRFITQSYSVRKGLTKSCGCLIASLIRDGALATKHGESRSGRWTPEYRAWVNMMTRCYNPRSTRFRNWGGRGISVCEDWKRDFAAFLRALGRRPSPLHSLDRYPDHDGDYKPGNVRWATRREQALNQRSNRHITAFSETLTLIEWAEKIGMPQPTLLYRLDSGWSPERALTEPVRASMRHAHSVKEVDIHA